MFFSESGVRTAVAVFFPGAVFLPGAVFCALVEVVFCDFAGVGDLTGDACAGLEPREERTEEGLRLRSRGELDLDLDLLDLESDLDQLCIQHFIQGHREKDLVGSVDFWPIRSGQKLTDPDPHPCR